MRIIEVQQKEPHSFRPLKKRSHVVTPGSFLIDDLKKVIHNIEKTEIITQENKKKIAKLASEIIDSLKHS